MAWGAPSASYLLRGSFEDRSEYIRCERRKLLRKRRQSFVRGSPTRAARLHAGTDRKTWRTQAGTRQVRTVWPCGSRDAPADQLVARVDTGQLRGSRAGRSWPCRLLAVAPDSASIVSARYPKSASPVNAAARSARPGGSPRAAAGQRRGRPCHVLCHTIASQPQKTNRAGKSYGHRLFGDRAASARDDGRHARLPAMISLHGASATCVGGPRHDHLIVDMARA